MVRHLVRDMLVFCATVVTAPLWVLTWIEAVGTRGEIVLTTCSELLSLFPGPPGLYLRRAYYHMCLDAFASDCHIGFGTTVAHREIRIGRRVYIGNRCTLGKAIIEDDTLVGSNVDILSGRHQHHFEQRDRPIEQQGGSFRQIRIGSNSWVGNSSVLMADVGEECVIGAGSVVVKPIPPRSVAAGNPAVVKKPRASLYQAGAMPLDRRMA
jgi:acetyltransferase-like isoleucine patch superfamily enzyme